MGRYFTKEAKVKEEELTAAISQSAYPLKSKADLKPLFDRIGDARIVMLGEASHGTHEYYTWRTHISKYLIEQKGFDFIAVEGDWPDCYRLNRFIKGYDIENKSAFKLLQTFNRWPTWMWANTEIVRLAAWLKAHNAKTADGNRAGFYGLDVYSLFESIDEILRRLGKIDPALARTVRARYECFDRFGNDEKEYARSLAAAPRGCGEEVARNLRDLLSLRLPNSQIVEAEIGW